jgi:hypothetical protein
MARIAIIFIMTFVVLGGLFYTRLVQFEEKVREEQRNEAMKVIARVLFSEKVLQIAGFHSGANRVDVFALTPLNISVLK